MRGFASIGLFQPKDHRNVGSVMRAAGCYDAAMVVVSGTRYRRSVTDTQKAYRHIPLVECDDLRGMVPFGAVPVAVDLVESARSLTDYTHPSSAFYVFGPEDGTLGADVLSWCRDVIYVPTRHCMNLAATVNVILYDRLCKQLARRAA